MKIEAFKCDTCAKIIRDGYSINGKVTLLSLNENQELTESDTILKEKEFHICKSCMYNVLGLEQSKIR